MFSGGSDASQSKRGVEMVRNAPRTNLMLQSFMVFRLSSVEKFKETQFGAEVEYDDLPISSSSQAVTLLVVLHCCEYTYFNFKVE